MRELKIEELKMRAGGVGNCGNDKGNGGQNNPDQKQSNCGKRS